MDPRRLPRTVIDPKVRQVGFVTSQLPPDRSLSAPSDVPSSSPVSDLSPASNTLSPVMIPPPRHPSLDTLSLVSSRAPPPSSPVRRDGSESLLGTATPPTAVSPLAAAEGGEDGRWKGAASLPASGGGEMMGALARASVGVVGSFSSVSSLTKVSVVKLPSGLTDRELTMNEARGGTNEVQKDRSVVPKINEKPSSKAERRALQEAQRAAKAAAKDGAPLNVKQPKIPKASQKKEVPPNAAAPRTPDKKDADRPLEKDRKKEAPHPRMQFDDTSRVGKSKKHTIVNRSETRNRVELFRHLPQYVHGTLLPDLESKFFLLELMHPSVYKVGVKYLAGDITGGNARCIAMLLAFRDVIRNYSTPPEKTLIRDLTAKISSYVSFLIECRPLSVSMGNAIRYLKNRIAKLPVTLSEAEAKLRLLSDIDGFISEKIILADKVIVEHAITKIRDGDVLLTYGFSCVVEMILLSAYECGKQFRVVVVDSRPKLEGQSLLRRLVAKGIECTYTHINAISYIMHEVTCVLLGASSVFSNGTVYSRVGTACVALVAHAFRIPVLVCCEAYKFHNRVQLDSICSNELGDPNAIAKVTGREDLDHLDNWASNENLQLLNLTYDVMPSDYVSLVITDYGMVPPTSVPVIVREYCREHTWV